MPGTLRKNKPEIPQEFQPSKERAAFSSIFGFNSYMSLAKKGKAVVLLSTQHYLPSIDTATPARKPEIIRFYNETKGAVDSFDQKIEKFTCRRQTNRWTYNTFMFMLDVAALNAFILCMLRNSAQMRVDESRRRRKSIEEFAKSLMRPAVQGRLRNAEARQMRGTKEALLECMARCL